jgi:hypothetical protein
MTGFKYTAGLMFVLIIMFSGQLYSQQITYPDSLYGESSLKAKLKPVLNYSAGTSFIVIPRSGTVTGFSLSSSLSVPLSQKLSVNGGIIARRLYSGLWNSNPEAGMYGAFNELSVYGSASYRLNPKLTLYGSAIKRLTDTSPFYSLPKSSYEIGSTYDFGSFSMGVSLQMSKWNDAYSPWPINPTRGFNSPFEQRSGMFY